MLARVRNRQMEWATTRMSRSLVLEMMNTAVEEMENHHITAMLTSVLEEVWKRVEVTRLLGEMERDEEIQRRVENELVKRRKEEEDLMKAVLSEENKRKRKERIRKIKRSWQNKTTAQELRLMLKLISRLSLEDLEMDIDALEEKAMELMEVGELEEVAQGNHSMEVEIVDTQEAGVRVQEGLMMCDSHIV